MASRVGAGCRSRFSRWQALNNKQASGRTTLRKRENIEHSAFGGVFAKIRHCIEEAQCSGPINSIQTAGYRGTRPTSYAGKYGNVFFAIRAFVCDGLPNDAGAGLKLPERISIGGIDSLEPAVHGSVECNVPCSDKRTAPDGKLLVDAPNIFSLDGIPSRKDPAVSTRAGIHPDLHAHIRRAGYKVCLRALRFVTEIVVRQIKKAGLR